MGKMSIKAAGAPSGIFYKYDEKEMKADMAAAIPVADAKANVKGYQLIEIPAGKALQIAYYGAYEKSGDAHMAIDKYMKEKNLTMNTHVIEEYVTDPMHEPDTSKWLTNIYYMVK
jgi:effector-binding domain-containing protein